jgi:hypothetical protein
MPGSARSLQISQFIGLRVASTNYYPAHSKNGVNISQRLVINAFMNIASRANNGQGRNEVITLTAWGKLADSCAISMSPGKEFHCFAELHTYDGRVFENNQPMMRADGTPLTTRKTSFTITRLLFGMESAKTINMEIQQGIRMPNWDKEGTPDYEHWRQQLNARKGLQYDPSKPMFGYAKVAQIQGPGIGAYNPNLNTQQGGNAAAVEQAVVNAAGNPAAVSPTFAGQPATAPAAAPAAAPGAPVFAAPAGV